MLQDPGFALSYWQRVVRQVGAKRVIPVHWDDMGRPLEDGLKPAGWPTGFGARNRARLACFARHDGVEFGETGLFDPVVLLPPVARQPAQRRAAAADAPVPLDVLEKRCRNAGRQTSASSPQ